MQTPEATAMTSCTKAQGCVAVRKTPSFPPLPPALSLSILFLYNPWVHRSISIIVGQIKYRGPTNLLSLRVNSLKEPVRP